MHNFTADVDRINSLMECDNFPYEEMVRLSVLVSAALNQRHQEMAAAKYTADSEHLDESDYCRKHDLFASLFDGTCPYC